MANSLNVISFFHGSTIREAARVPIVLHDLHGSSKVPCAMDIVDRLEVTEKALGDRFQATLSASGPGSRGEFKIQADENPEKIDSLESCKGGHGAHTVHSFAQHIVENWKDDAYNLVHVRGHGHAHQDVMGMPTEDFLAGLGKVGKMLGRPIDTLLIESCLMGSLDVLNGMNGSVSTVIASQEVLNAKALPHKEMFSAALDGEMEPRQVTARLLEAAGTHGTPDTLVGVEPEKLAEVSKSLSTLKQKLDAAADKQLRKRAKDALTSSARFPRRNVETGYRRKLDLRDLGELTGNLESAELGPEVVAANRKVKTDLETAVIGVERGPGYETASGLSVRSESVMKKQGFSLFGLFA